MKIYCPHPIHLIPASEPPCLGSACLDAQIVIMMKSGYAIAVAVAVAIAALALVVALLPAPPPDVVSSGTCGDDLAWTLNSEGDLTISGSGPMYDYNDVGAPWGWSVNNVTIKHGVTHIGEGAFAGCRSLASVEIPSSVTTIGMCAFLDCTSLAPVEIPPSMNFIAWSVFDGCTSLSSVVIPSSVTAILDGAFSGCTSLSSVVIPPWVTTIGYEAFYGIEFLDADGVTILDQTAESLRGYTYKGSDGRLIRIVA